MNYWGIFFIGFALFTIFGMSAIFSILEDHIEKERRLEK